MSKLFSTDLGLATFGAEALQIIDLLEQCFLRWAKDFDAEPAIFPPLIKVADLNQIDYFRNFPQLGVFTTKIQEHLLKEKYIKGGDIEVIPNQDLASSQYALPSAACYHVYLSLKERVIYSPQIITTLGKCFRNEDYYRGLERLLCFTMREIVCVGAESDVRVFLAKSKEKLREFASYIGLPVEVKTASDPFFDPEGMRAKMQKLFPVKEELIYQDSLSIASVNFHLNFFGDRCQIRTKDDKSAFSGCMGMGIERWIYALTDTFEGNVETICDRLQSYLENT